MEKSDNSELKQFLVNGVFALLGVVAIFVAGTYFLAISGYPPNAADFQYELGLTILVNGSIWYFLTMLYLGLGRQDITAEKLASIEAKLDLLLEQENKLPNPDETKTTLSL